MGQNGEIDDVFCPVSRGCRKIQTSQLDVHAKMPKHWIEIYQRDKSITGNRIGTKDAKQFSNQFPSGKIYIDFETFNYFLKNLSYALFFWQLRVVFLLENALLASKIFRPILRYYENHIIIFFFSSTSSLMF